MLIVLGGLPGTGKTTIGKALAVRLAAVYLRIDEMEQALRRQGWQSVGAAGYVAAQAIARSNLLLGRSVVADCVNPVPASREGWRAVAREAGQAILDVELVCSDPVEHRRRIETRPADIAGLVLPTWASVAAHVYVARHDAHLVLDTAVLRIADSVDAILVRAETSVRQAHTADPGTVPH